MPGSSDLEPLRSSLDPEFVDEGPGSYLAELGPRRASVAWGAANLAATAGLGCACWASRLGADSQWFAVARLVWSLLPVSALILLVVTLWQLGTAYTEKPPARVIASLALSVASIAVWSCLAFIVGVLEIPS
jgi:hypothetical protein